MSEEQAQSHASAMSLGRAFLYYVAALVVLLVLMYATLIICTRYAQAGQIAFGVMFVIYFAIGAWLNRTVLRTLIEWHPAHNTLENVSTEKGEMMILWPFKYSALFLKLGVSKYL
jgi:hypothetical protein